MGRTEPAMVALSSSPTDGLVTLNPSDPFEAALIEMVLTNRAKRSDYAIDGDPFSNFHSTSAMMGVEGFGPLESALFNIYQKLTRLSSLRSNGRLGDPKNESVEDTYKDLAVYATILYAMYLSFK